MRLLFKQKAYKNELIKQGLNVIDLVCVDYDPFVNIFLKLKSNNGVVYLKASSHKKYDNACEVILEASGNYLNSLNGSSDFMSTSEFIENQIYFKILFDTLGKACLNHNKFSIFAKAIYRSFDGAIDFSNHIESIDLSQLYNLSEEVS